MPDYLTIVLSGLVSLVVSISAVQFRFWLQNRREVDEWYGKIHSVTEQSIQKVYSKPEKPDEQIPLEALVEGDSFDDLDELVDELWAELTNPPKGINSEVYTTGHSALRAYNRFMYLRELDSNESEEIARELGIFLTHLSAMRRIYVESTDLTYMYEN